MPLSNEQLLAEVEDCLRTVPSFSQGTAPEVVAWMGRVSAIIHAWSPVQAVGLSFTLSQMRSSSSSAFLEGYGTLMTLLNHARSTLLLETVGPLSVPIDTGRVFDYFDEVRKVISMANADVLFVDPYLDADFVARYLPHIPKRAQIRLLTREKLSALLPAVTAFAQQESVSVQVRSASGFHDRLVFVDRTACYQSGASFKDGARKAPTTLTQITDAFAAVLQTYESIWNKGTAHP